MEAQVYVAGAGDVGLRLDRFLAQHMPQISRARVQELIEAGVVSVGDGLVRASYRMKGGERVEVSGETQRPQIKAEAEAIELDVVLDDPDFAVVNKASGMTVHAGAGDLSRNRGTLVNAMLHRFQTLSNSGDELRPGIVHRLDRDTSGLVIVAKTDFAHRRLAEQFQTREVRKTYVALVHGVMKPKSGTMRLAITRDPIHRKRMRAVREESARARAAVTHFEEVESISGAYGRFTLLQVRIETGRTHQIRAHMAALRHPVVGDALYGAAAVLRSSNAELPELSLGRNFLHAAELDFKHPQSGEPVHCHAPLPGQLQDFLHQLRQGSI
ncbi:MAG: RluA family pseudouridine synthase [Acidobacteriaceae bacterium]